MISEMLRQWCQQNEIPISEQQLLQFQTYASLLQEWNQKMNLTAITDDEGIAVKHFIDSISLLKYDPINAPLKLVDIGTGAGFPGIPLKIMRPSLELTLLDSLNKRLIFLDTVCQTLHLNVNLVHTRAEEGCLKPEFREQFDIAVSRAVAGLPALCEYCLPYVKKNGRFFAMKGPDADQELLASQKALSVLGGALEKRHSLTLPDGSQRSILIIAKTGHTPPQYPRRGQKINKHPI